MKVEIYSDVICPWCFIGKRRFDQAREQRPRLELDVQWRAFELNPRSPRAEWTGRSTAGEVWRS